MMTYDKEYLRRAAKNYYQFHKTRDDRFFWGNELFYEMKTQEERAEYLMILLEEAPFERDYLSLLGAGFLEDIDTVVFIKMWQKSKDYSRDSDVDKKLCEAILSGMYTELLKPEDRKFVEDYIRYHPTRNFPEKS